MSEETQLTPRMAKAVQFATEVHGAQARKGTTIPYIIHPLGVARTLSVFGYEEDLVIAGLFHDIVEDTPKELNDIEEHFGAKVAVIVKGCSEPHREASWQDRKQHTIDFIEGLNPDDGATQDQMIVTLCDKLDNVSAMAFDLELFGDKLWDRFNKGVEPQSWYYGELNRVFNKRCENKTDAKLAQLFGEKVGEVFK